MRSRKNAGCFDHEERNNNDGKTSRVEAVGFAEPDAQVSTAIERQGAGVGEGTKYEEAGLSG